MSVALHCNVAISTFTVYFSNTDNKNNPPFSCFCHTNALPLQAEVLQMHYKLWQQRLSESLHDLLEGLKKNAARENRTLNNYVESVLLDIVYHEPNNATKTAIEEVMSGKNPQKTYSDIDDMFNDILNEKE